jgi:CheY-like chemotaxis protein
MTRARRRAFLAPSAPLPASPGGPSLQMRVKRLVTLTEAPCAAARPSQGYLVARARPTPDSRSDPALSAAPPAILVVDDDKATRNTLRFMLERAGFTVAVAAGGRQALRSFQERPIAAVVTDILMPSMDGLRLIRELLALQPGICIVAISGAEMRLDIARQLGAKAVLRKPVSRIELVQTLRLLTGEIIPREAEPVPG